jgi:hypothetical protein
MPRAPGMEMIMRSQLDDSDTKPTQPRTRPQTWRERHALKIMGVVMAAMFATVIIAQVAC